MNSISWMTKNLCDQDYTKTITIEEYKNWRKQWIFDALKDYRLGQSFCEYFGISNASPLYYFRDNNFSDMWIHDNYLQK